MEILDKIKGIIKSKIMQMFDLQPASTQSISITEELSHDANVLKNKVLYRGNSSEIWQFFSQLNTNFSSGRFWASSATSRIRKIHLSYITTVIDRYVDIVCQDLDSITVDDAGANEVWEAIANENDFTNLLEDAVRDALVTGDGAFKVTMDKSVSNMPILEFVAADRVDYNYKHSRVSEVIFLTEIHYSRKSYKLAEIYGYGYIDYKLYDSYGNEIALSTLPQTSELQILTFDSSVLMAVPFKVFNSTLYKHRGKSLFDTKVEEADALDEVASQWLDAVRQGRVKKYIPESMIPRDPESGAFKMGGFTYDDNFVTVKSQMSENVADQIQVVQPSINYDAYVNSYANFLDMLLQGIISPSTLGIDLKKTDNAESQREKEKITCYMRGKIVDALNDVLPQLVNVALNVNTLVAGGSVKEYDVSVSFGEYASTDFSSVVAVVADAHLKGIMSLEKCVEELYGDSLTDEEKAEEVERLKAEQGLTELTEPGLVIDDEKTPNEEEDVIE